ncbi:lipase [Longimycelium tulufanense]|uniref:Lipase n=1 Tax=Longimycelium tulufanense TaxID=907463 RepID=A0A8J3FTE2_9PSEU|nr:lipase [Longimycelium tulufanense]
MVHVRLFRAGLVAILFLSGLVAVGTPSALARDTALGLVTTPNEDSFYQPPYPLPDGPPGTIIRSRPVELTADPALPVPVRTWQLLYESSSALGHPNAVSGTLLVPTSPWNDGPRPLVTYAVGTHGLGDQCAPSYLMRTGREDELQRIGEALQRGWAVVVTDYEGLGTPGVHTYTAGPAEGHAVLDAARAAQRFPGVGLADSPIAIWGYSQGGQAASFAGELQPSYAPELAVRGVAAGGVPADLTALAHATDGRAGSGLLLAGAIGQATAYPELPFESVLSTAGKKAVPDVATSCLAEFTTRYSFRYLNEFTTVRDLLSEPQWAARINENHAGQRAPGAPILVYHGTFDELIPFQVGKQLADDYCHHGATVSWRPLPLMNHMYASIVGAPLAVSWLGDRFAGAAPPTSC